MRHGQTPNEAYSVAQNGRPIVTQLFFMVSFFVGLRAKEIAALKMGNVFDAEGRVQRLFPGIYDFHSIISGYIYGLKPRYQARQILPIFIFSKMFTTFNELLIRNPLHLKSNLVWRADL